MLAWNRIIISQGKIRVYNGDSLEDEIPQSGHVIYNMLDGYFLHSSITEDVTLFSCQTERYLISDDSEIYLLPASTQKIKKAMARINKKFWPDIQNYINSK